LPASLVAQKQNLQPRTVEDAGPYNQKTDRLRTCRFFCGRFMNRPYDNILIWRQLSLPILRIYFSTISKISMGQALTQMPQAMHLETGLSSLCTMTFMGHTATQAPQPTHSFLLII